MIKTIIFDADYTLYKINKKRAYDCLYSFLSLKLKAPKEKIMEDHKEILNKLKLLSEPDKRKLSYSIKEIFEKYGFENNEKILEEGLKIFWNQIIEDLGVLPGIADILRELNKNYKLAIASDEFIEILERKLEKIFGEWENYFEFLITPDTTGSMKPSKKYYEIILEKTGFLPEEAIMIGDSWNRDLEPAKSLGIKTILISDEKEGEPDFWIKDIKEIIKIANNLNK